MYEKKNKAQLFALWKLIAEI